MKHLFLVACFIASVLASMAGVAAQEPTGKLYTIPSWGDYAVVYAGGIDPAMDSAQGMENMFKFWKARGFTGVFLRSDLLHYAPFIERNPRVQMNAPLALMWKHIDDLAASFDYFAAAQQAAQRSGLEFWVYHPHIYSDGAPKEAGVPGPGRMVPWNYVSKAMLDHPEIVTVDRKGNKYWMVPEYAYPEARRAKVAEFVHMATKYGIKRFIANMRSEVSQLQAPADKADRFGFNQPVVDDMRRLHGVDILTDPRFDVDAPDFDAHDPMVGKWRDLRGGYLTQLYRDLRAGLRSVDPQIKIAITLAGEYIGPPLGNWRTDWRTWVDEGLVDYLVSPVFFEATLDHDADKKGYLTNARAGTGTVSHEALKAYIEKSRHPDIQVIAVGGPPYFFTPSPVPAGADGMQCDAWYGAYHLAWYQRWQQWHNDVREFGHIRFIEQNFDAVSPKDFAMPSGGWGGMAYDPKLRACAGAWWRLGDGSDTKPFAQSLYRHGNSGQAIQLTRAADGSGTLTGWHNSSPDRSKYAAAVDTSMTSGHCTFEFWLRRKSAESAVAAYLQGDNREFEVGLRVAPGDGRLSYSTGTLHGAGKWAETRITLPEGQWQKFTLDVDIDHLSYSGLMGDGKTTALWGPVPLSAAKARTVELPGVNLPIAVPVFKEFKSVLFVPEGVPGNVTHLDDVGVNWRPAMPFAGRGQVVEFSDDFESYAPGTAAGSAALNAAWQLPADCRVANDTSFGPGARSLHVAGGSAITARTPHPLKTGTRLLLDLDVFVRSGESSPSIMPGAATLHPHRTSSGWKGAKGRMIAGVMTGDGVWRLWNGTQWIDSKTPVHYDVWNHLQLALNESGGYSAVVQPVGQVAAAIGRGRLVEATPGADLTLTIDSSATPGHVSCYDNVLVTSGPKASGQAAESLPVLTVPVRVHLMHSATQARLNTTLTETDVQRIFGKVNKIWAQAGIHLAVEPVAYTLARELPRAGRLKEDFALMKAAVPKESLSATAINVYYVKEVGPNGFYYGEAIAVKDTAALKQVPGGLDEPIPRVTAHEIGHALGLPHRQDDTNLMASGKSGYLLNGEEIQTARAKAGAYQVRGEGG